MASARRQFGQQASLFPPDRTEVPLEQRGAVFTKRWVVELVLDLAGFKDDRDLVSSLTIEPAAGEGAFLVPIAERLIASCRRLGRPVQDCAGSLLAFELDPATADSARATVYAALLAQGVAPADAAALSQSWIRAGDYLHLAPTLPPADFVVGNPPYVRIEDLPANIQSFYRSSYRTMKGRADLYVAFFEAALGQLRAGGVCSFICADRWMLNQYGAALRDLVSSGFALETVVEMHEADGFLAEVSAYPAITVIRRGEQETVVVARADRAAEACGATELGAVIGQVATGGHPAMPNGLRAARVSGWYRGQEPWPLVDPGDLELLRRLEAAFDPIGSPSTSTRVGIGVASGADAIFLTRDPDLVEPSRLLPLALAEDLRTGSLAWSGNFLVNPWDANGLVRLADYPRLARYLESHRPRLGARHCAREQGKHWYRTIDRVDPALTARPKLYLPDIKGSIHPVLDRGTTYPHHNLYFVVSDAWDLEVLGGLLMSRVAQFFVECYAVRMRGGTLRFQAQYIRRIRVPHPDQVTGEQAAGLRRAFASRNVDAATALAAEIYDLQVLVASYAGDRPSDVLPLPLSGVQERLLQQNPRPVGLVQPLALPA